MAKIGLISPSSKKRNYQGLAPLSAIMPPHWMAVRASYHRAQGNEVVVCDCAVEELNREKFADCRVIEIMPSGVHPHAFIHEQVQYPPAWDLFDLNRYYAHNWQTWGRRSRHPYGTLATSVSCPNSCAFCNIDNYYNSGYRRQSTERAKADLEVLYDLGVRNIKMMDELFVTSEKRMFDFCNLVVGRRFKNLNIWGYARLDGLLRLAHINNWRRCFSEMKKAGINWICIGIESGNQAIRQKMGKGKASNKEIVELIQIVKDADIAVLGNFMFGFPMDDMNTMKQTLDLAIELKCEYSNFYCMVPYPDTGIEVYAKKQGWKFPPSPSAYSQYAYDFQPLPTHNLTAAEVLEFRDRMWQEYHTNSSYLRMIEEKFGPEVREEIEDITKIELKRKLLEEA